ncbi:dTMP kinase [Leptolyngbya sp. 15MV]|nr:dTMP kinase [Leptolyngbya sp. 15MV]
MNPARFITLEGGEGGGKSTQARLLAAHLSAQGIPVLLTRDPGGAPAAEAIRRLLLDGQGLDPVAEAMLHFAARREHVVATIRPALAAGLWVISDRFADSTRAYQCHGQGVPGEVYRRLADLALEGFAPDLTLILDVPPEAGMARAAARAAEAGGVPDAAGGQAAGRAAPGFPVAAAGRGRYHAVIAESGMGQILVRHLDDGVIESLKARALERGTSLEQVARDALGEAASRSHRAAWIAEMDALRAQVRPQPNWTAAAEIRRARDALSRRLEPDNLMSAEEFRKLGG